MCYITVAGATAVPNITCLHLNRKKAYGGDFLTLKITRRITLFLRFLYNQILISRDDGLLLIQANQLLNAAEIFA